MLVELNEHEDAFMAMLLDSKKRRVLLEACEYLKPRTMGADVARLGEFIEALTDMN